MDQALPKQKKQDTVIFVLHQTRSVYNYLQRWGFEQVMRFVIVGYLVVLAIE